MDISELKVGDIVVAGREPKRQFFYIHKMDDNELQITSSGVREETDCGYFPKLKGWRFRRKATEEEVRLFYQIIRDRGYKFNMNVGVRLDFQY